MTYEEFSTWLTELVEEGGLQPDEREDLLEQRRLFDQERSLIQREFPGLVVGFVEGNRVYSSSVTELLDTAEHFFHGQIYFEPVAYPQLWNGDAMELR